jgi:hypothetical protein
MRTMWSIIAVVSAFVVVAVAPADAQSLKAKVDLKAPAPRLPNGKPDLAASGRDPPRPTWFGDSRGRSATIACSCCHRTWKSWRRANETSEVQRRRQDHTLQPRLLRHCHDGGRWQDVDGHPRAAGANGLPRIERRYAQTWRRSDHRRVRQQARGRPRAATTYGLVARRARAEFAFRSQPVFDVAARHGAVAEIQLVGPHRDQVVRQRGRRRGLEHRPVISCCGQCCFFEDRGLGGGRGFSRARGSGGRGRSRFTALCHSFLSRARASSEVKRRWKHDTRTIAFVQRRSPTSLLRASKDETKLFQSMLTRGVRLPYRPRIFNTTSVALSTSVTAFARITGIESVPMP